LLSFNYSDHLSTWTSEPRLKSLLSNYFGGILRPAEAHNEYQLEGYLLNLRVLKRNNVGWKKN
jgi:hypothetical protein